MLSRNVLYGSVKKKLWLPPGSGRAARMGPCQFKPSISIYIERLGRLPLFSSCTERKNLTAPTFLKPLALPHCLYQGGRFSMDGCL